MTIAKQIAFARKMGITSGYARSMSGFIRSASSDRTVKALRAAIAEDKAEHLFLRFDTNSPVAA